jgi:hypothetical protein
MSNRPNRDAKTEAIYAAARKIIEAERAQRQSKTNRLRAQRLVRDGHIKAQEQLVPRDNRGERPFS